jgi:hypothetical protein
MDATQVLAHLASVDRSEVRERVASVSARNRAKFAEKTKLWLGVWNRKFKENFGYDGLAVLNKPGFNLRSAARQLKERGLREDVSTSQLYALSTGLITQNLSGAYDVVKVMYRDVCKVLTSAHSEESYFPLQRGNVPSPVEDNEALPSSSIGGILTRIKNYRFGDVIEVSANLEKDDATGQVAEMAAAIGDKMAYAEEKWWASQLISAYVAGNIRLADGGTSATGIIPGMNIAGSAPAGYGGPTCDAGPATRDRIANLYTAADYVTDIEGDFLPIEIDCGVFANADKIAVNTILKSDFNPATPAGTANVVPGIFARNPLEDIFVAKFTRFFKYFTGSALNGGNVWFLGEAGKIGSFQDRDPLEVIMELPNSGKSFDATMKRTKAERRFGAGVTIPEFALRGN